MAYNTVEVGVFQGRLCSAWGRTTQADGLSITGRMLA